MINTLGARAGKVVCDSSDSPSWVLSRIYRVTDLYHVKSEENVKGVTLFKRNTESDAGPSRWGSREAHTLTVRAVDDLGNRQLSKVIL